MQFKQALFIAGLMAGVAAAQNAHAAGFYIQEQSVKGQGAAFAGSAANPEDASVIFNNPAAMTDLSVRQGVAGLAVIHPSSSFTNQGSTFGGNDGGNPFGYVAVPSLYAAAPVNEGTWWLGLAVTAPFGLENEYNSGWFGRYNSTQSTLKTVDIAPTAAVRLSNNVSLGAGIDIQHAYANLQQAVFTGGPDATATVEGSSWKVGYNLGVLWDVDPATKLGLHYRSAITQHIEGHLAVPGVLPTMAAQADLKLPDVIEFGATRQICPQLKVMGTVNWFGWNNFNEIRVQTLALPDIVSVQDYRNTYAVALGAEWKQNDQWSYRGGIQFDETPTGSHRDTRVPDSNRFWLSGGASYNFTPAFSVDGALSHLFMGDAGVNVVNQFGLGPAITTKGTASNQGTIAAVQGVWKF